MFGSVRSGLLDACGVSDALVSLEDALGRNWLTGSVLGWESCCGVGFCVGIHSYA